MADFQIDACYDCVVNKQAWEREIQDLKLRFLSYKKKIVPTDKLITEYAKVSEENEVLKSEIKGLRLESNHCRNRLIAYRRTQIPLEETCEKRKIELENVNKELKFEKDLRSSSEQHAQQLVQLLEDRGSELKTLEQKNDDQKEKYLALKKECTAAKSENTKLNKKRLKALKDVATLGNILDKLDCLPKYYKKMIKKWQNAVQSAGLSVNDLEDTPARIFSPEVAFSISSQDTGFDSMNSLSDDEDDEQTSCFYLKEFDQGLSKSSRNSILNVVENKVQLRQNSKVNVLKNNIDKKQKEIYLGDKSETSIHYNCSDKLNEELDHQVTTDTLCKKDSIEKSCKIQVTTQELGNALINADLQCNASSIECHEPSEHSITHGMHIVHDTLSAFSSPNSLQNYSSEASLVPGEPHLSSCSIFDVNSFSLWDSEKCDNIVSPRAKRRSQRNLVKTVTAPTEISECTVKTRSCIFESSPNKSPISGICEGSDVILVDVKKPASPVSSLLSLPSTLSPVLSLEELGQDWFLVPSLLSPLPSTPSPSRDQLGGDATESSNYKVAVELCSIAVGPDWSIPSFCSVEVQTSCVMCSVEVQTSCAMCSVEVQTEGSMCSSMTQTEVSTCSIMSQTECVVSDSNVQTGSIMCDVNIQTDIMCHCLTKGSQYVCEETCGILATVNQTEIQTIRPRQTLQVMEDDIPLINTAVKCVSTLEDATVQNSLGTSFICNNVTSNTPPILGLNIVCGEDRDVEAICSPVLDTPSKSLQIETLESGMVRFNYKPEETQKDKILLKWKNLALWLSSGNTDDESVVDIDESAVDAASVVDDDSSIVDDDEEFEAESQVSSDTEVNDECSSVNEVALGEKWRIPMSLPGAFVLQNPSCSVSNSPHEWRVPMALPHDLKSDEKVIIEDRKCSVLQTKDNDPVPTLLINTEFERNQANLKYRRVCTQLRERCKLHDKQRHTVKKIGQKKKAKSIPTGYDKSLTYTNNIKGNNEHLLPSIKSGSNKKCLFEIYDTESTNFANCSRKRKHFRKIHSLKLSKLKKTDGTNGSFVKTTPGLLTSVSTGVYANVTEGQNIIKTPSGSFSKTYFKKNIHNKAYHKNRKRQKINESEIRTKFGFKIRSQNRKRCSLKTVKSSSKKWRKKPHFKHSAFSVTDTRVSLDDTLLDTTIVVATEGADSEVVIPTNNVNCRERHLNESFPLNSVVSKLKENRLESKSVNLETMIKEASVCCKVIDTCRQNNNSLLEHITVKTSNIAMECLSEKPSLAACQETNICRQRTICESIISNDSVIENAQDVSFEKINVIRETEPSTLQFRDINESIEEPNGHFTVNNPVCLTNISRNVLVPSIPSELQIAVSSKHPSDASSFVHRDNTEQIVVTTKSMVSCSPVLASSEIVNKEVGNILKPSMNRACDNAKVVHKLEEMKSVNAGTCVTDQESSIVHNDVGDIVPKNTNESNSTGTKESNVTCDLLGNEHNSTTTALDYNTAKILMFGSDSESECSDNSDEDHYDVFPSKRKKLQLDLLRQGDVQFNKKAKTVADEQMVTIHKDLDSEHVDKINKYVERKITSDSEVVNPCARSGMLGRRKYVKSSEEVSTTVPLMNESSPNSKLEEETYQGCTVKQRRIAREPKSSESINQQLLKHVYNEAGSSYQVQSAYDSSEMLTSTNGEWENEDGTKSNTTLEQLKTSQLSTSTNVSFNFPTTSLSNIGAENNNDKSSLCKVKYNSHGTIQKLNSVLSKASTVKIQRNTVLAESKNSVVTIKQVQTSIATEPVQIVSTNILPVPTAVKKDIELQRVINKIKQDTRRTGKVTVKKLSKLEKFRAKIIKVKADLITDNCDKTSPTSPKRYKYQQIKKLCPAKNKKSSSELSVEESVKNRTSKTQRGNKKPQACPRAHKSLPPSGKRLEVKLKKKKQTTEKIDDDSSSCKHVTSSCVVSNKVPKLKIRRKYTSEISASNSVSHSSASSYISSDNSETSLLSPKKSLLSDNAPQSAPQCKPSSHSHISSTITSPPTQLVHHSFACSPSPLSPSLIQQFSKCPVNTSHTAYLTPQSSINSPQSPPLVNPNLNYKVAIIPSSPIHRPSYEQGILPLSIPYSTEDNVICTRTVETVTETASQLMSVKPLELNNVKNSPSVQSLKQFKIEGVLKKALKLYQENTDKRMGSKHTSHSIDSEKAFVNSTMDNLLSNDFTNEKLNSTINSFCCRNMLDSLIITKCIVQRVSKDVSSRLDLSHTPPAPPLTATQQRLITLVLKLCTSQQDRYKFLLEQVLTGIEYCLLRLGSAPYIPSACSLARFYAALCKTQNDTGRVQRFLYDAMYCLKFKAFPVIFTVLTVYPECLPSANSGYVSPLSVCIVHIIMNASASNYQRAAELKIRALQSLLQHTYGYSNDHTTDQLFLDSITKLKAGDSKYLPLLILLGKYENCDWTSKKLLSCGILPAIDEWKKGSLSEEGARLAILLIGYVVKVFPKEQRTVTNPIIRLLCCFLLEDREASHQMQETVASSLILLSRHQHMKVLVTLKKWQPTQEISEELVRYTQLLMEAHTIHWWESFMFK